MDIINRKEWQIPSNIFLVAKNAQKSKETLFNELMTKRKWPENGWSDDLIEYFVKAISDMDSNNFEKHYSLGEREGRVICDLVRRRHYRFAHGVGRSGNLTAAQPKAIGSTILSNITEAMVLDWLHFQGLRCCQRAAVVPLATGMTLSLCFLALKKKRPLAKYIIWSRIDQVSCVKSMTTAGFQPIVIDTVPLIPTEGDRCGGGGLITDVEAFEEVLEQYKNKRQEILCIMSTSSCFAPRNCDNLVVLALLAKKYDIPHVINNAYGLQSTYLTHQVQQAHRLGRVDLFVQSTDKNLMVPVGGAVVASASSDIVSQVVQTYAGRGSITPTLDVFMTLLSLGQKGYAELSKNRKEQFQSLSKKLQQFVKEFHCGKVAPTKGNPISLAIHFNGSFGKSRASELGSRLFTRGVTGARAVVPGVIKIIDSCTFHNWGCHSNHRSIIQPYLTVAASIGITNEDIENFIRKLKDCWLNLKDKSVKDGA